MTPIYGLYLTPFLSNPRRLVTNRLERRLLGFDRFDSKTKRQLTQLLD